MANAYEDLTEDELVAAIEHAEGNAKQKPTSEEYRQWWTLRAEALKAELEHRITTGRGSS